MKELPNAYHYIYPDEMDTEESVMRSVKNLCIDDDNLDSSTTRTDIYIGSSFYAKGTKPSSTGSLVVESMVSKLSQHKNQNSTDSLSSPSRSSSLKAKDYPGSKISKKASPVKTGRKRMSSPPPVQPILDDFEIGTVKKSEAEKQFLREQRGSKILAYKKQIQQEMRAQRLRNRQKARSSSVGANNERIIQNTRVRRASDSPTRTRSVSFASESSFIEENPEHIHYHADGI